MEFWGLVDCDLHDVYGINVWDDQFMASTPWPMLRTRIVGLLSADTRIARALLPIARPVIPVG